MSVVMNMLISAICLSQSFLDIQNALLDKEFT
ncbi:hypothetical protein SAMN04490196_1533 [Pseudomonas moraviensis]|nr:hypothetical protein SAMN04490196_1533 [Pseudomonas moraviensis]